MLVSMVLMGCVWCGVLCLEGVLIEFVSCYGCGCVIFKWVCWGGWFFVVFVLIIVYG